MPEEVRHAPTTVGTSQHHKSQEVKDGPECWSDGKDGKSDSENSNSSKQHIIRIV